MKIFNKLIVMTVITSCLAYTGTAFAAPGGVEITSYTTITNINGGSSRKCNV